MAISQSVDDAQRPWRSARSCALLLGSRAPIAKDCADCGLADCGLELARWRFRALRPPRGPL
eukprot:1829201-Alexandrium_andersonii.AAC.1